jgi:hypothetical protein
MVMKVVVMTVVVMTVIIINIKKTESTSRPTANSSDASPPA